MLIHDYAHHNRLSPQDYIVIVAEHNRLDKLLDDIGDICAHLNGYHGDSGSLASCRARLPAFLHDIVDFAGKHFLHEESIMLNRADVTGESEYFDAHRKSHIQILRQLKTLAAECSLMERNDKTPQAYRHLSQNLTSVLEAHDRAFDTPFIRSTRM